MYIRKALNLIDKRTTKILFNQQKGIINCFDKLKKRKSYKIGDEKKNLFADYFFFCNFFFTFLLGKNIFDLFYFILFFAFTKKRKHEKIINIRQDKIRHHNFI